MALHERFGVAMDTDRMVAQFMDMVRIDSESGNEARFLEWLVPALDEVGATAGFDTYGNLIATLPALNSGAPPVLLSCHGDTVRPGVGITPVLQDGVIRSGGDTILGADDKAGIAEMLEALRVAPGAAAGRDRDLAPGGSGPPGREAAGLRPPHRPARVPARQRHARHHRRGRALVRRDRRRRPGQGRPRRHGTGEGHQRDPGRRQGDRGAHARPAGRRDHRECRHHRRRHDPERRAGHLHLRRGMPQPDARREPWRWPTRWCR